MISARTKAALKAAQARGVRLGGHRGFRQNAASVAHARAVKTTKANDRAADVLPTIRLLQTQGSTSLRQLAKGLTDLGIPAARGGATWTADGVSKVLKRA